MRKIVIVPNKNKDVDFKVSARVAEMLKNKKSEICIEKKYSTDLNGNASIVDSLPDDAELIIVIGGDGSVIDASVAAVEKGVPVLGINLGKLGYLAEVETDNLELLERIFQGKYEIEKKMLLSVTKSSSEGGHVSQRLAVNDVIISHDSYVGISEISLTNSFNESIKYRADGIILSTPVGSTAYSFSAGGPILSHDIEAIVATPICPHSFFNRSIVFNSDEMIKIRNTGSSALKISMDGRFFDELNPGDECTVCKADKQLSMLTFSGNNMFSALFHKMQKFENM